MIRPCRCDRVDPTPGSAKTPDQCSLCWKFWHDERYRKLWGDAPQAVTHCVHRAAKAHRFVVCDCPGGLPIFRCASPEVGGECCQDATTDKRQDAVEEHGLSVCASCRFATPATGEAAVPSVTYPCRHRQRGGKWVDVGSCDGKLVEVFPCTLANKECALEHQVPGAAICAACSHRAPVVAPQESRSEVVEVEIARLQGPTSRTTLDWALKPEVVEAHRREWKRFVSQSHEYPGGFTGDGIVTLGGGVKYFASAYVLCSLLRTLGCKLPIEWWMLDDREFDEDMRRVAESIPGVTVVNARDRVGDEPRCWGGWQAKAWAVMRSRFERVLFLDADQLPVADPTYLFESKSFTEKPLVTWRDLVNQSTLGVKVEAFLSAGIRKPSEWNEPHETGQFLIDKRRAWRCLQAAIWHSDHSDFFYHVGYGDTTQWLLSAAVTDTPYSMMPPCEWRGNGTAGAILQPDETGLVVFQHRCQPQSKLSLRKYNQPFPGQENYAEMTAALEDLRSKWSGVMHDLPPLASASGRYIERDGDDERVLYLLPNGKVRGGTLGEVAWGADDSRLVLRRDDGESVRLFVSTETGWRCGDILVSRDIPVPATHPGDAELNLYRDVRLFNEYRLRKSLEGAVVFDVGANQGFFTLACLDRGAASVTCFEPAEPSVAVLQRNVRSDRRVRIVEAALGRSDRPHQITTWGRNPRDAQSGGIRLILNDAGSPEGECVVIGLDEAIGDERVDLLKIDVEGHEWPVLFGSQKLSQVESIVGEWHLGEMGRIDYDCDGLIEGDPSLDKLRSLLTGHGFSVKIGHTIPDVLGHFWAWRGDRHPCCDV